MSQSATRRVSVAVALGLVVLFLSTIIAGTLSVITAGSALADWLVPFGNHAAMAVISIALILMVKGGSLREYGFRWGLPYNYVAMLLWSAGVGILAAIVGVLLPYPQMQLPFEGGLFQTILLVWIWASISEEMLTRGFIQGYLESLRERGISVGAVHISLPVIVAAIFFGLMHLALLTIGVHRIHVLNIVVFGVALGLIAGYFREKSGSLVPAIVVHAIFNITGWLVATVVS